VSDVHALGLNSQQAFWLFAVIVGNEMSSQLGGHIDYAIAALCTSPLSAAQSAGGACKARQSYAMEILALSWERTLCEQCDIGGLSAFDTRGVQAESRVRSSENYSAGGNPHPIGITILSYSK
jgi:hypothetical protein